MQTFVVSGDLQKPYTMNAKKQVSKKFIQSVNCKITSNVLGVLVNWELEMFKLASKSRQRKCTVF